MSRKNENVEQLQELIAAEKKKILKIKNIKFTNGEKVALRIIKNAEIALAQLEWNLTELKGLNHAN